MAHGVTVLSPHAHARIKRVDTAKAKAAPGVLCVLTGADAEADHLGKLTAHPMPEDFGAPKGHRTWQPILNAERVRYVGDRVAFVVGRDAGAGARRRRTGRGRVRAAAGGGEPGRRRQGRRAQGLGRQPERQHRLPADVRQQGRDRRRLRQRQARRQAAGGEQPHFAGRDGAAGRHRRLQRGRQFLHPPHDHAESARRAHGALARAACAGEPHPGDLARCRRRLRAQGRAVPRRRADAVGVAQDRPAGEVGRHPQREHAQRSPRPRDGLLRRAGARRSRQDPRAAGAHAVPARRLLRRPGAGGRRDVDPLRARGLRHPDHAHHVARSVHQHLAERALPRRRPSRGGLLHGAADRTRRARDRHGPGRGPAAQPHPAEQAALRDADALDLRQRRVRAPARQVHRQQRLEGLRGAQEGVQGQRQAARPRGELLHRVRRHLQRARGPALRSGRNAQHPGRHPFARPGPRHGVRAARARQARRAVRIDPPYPGRHRAGGDRARHLWRAQRHGGRQRAGEGVPRR